MISRDEDQQLVLAEERSSLGGNMIEKLKRGLSDPDGGGWLYC